MPTLVVWGCQDAFLSIVMSERLEEVRTLH
jgi:hypothetical protein